MIPVEKQAAHLLTGKVLKDGWKVIRKIKRVASNSGGVYSACYEVAQGARKGFLKAFDYSGADKVGEDSANQLKDILNAFTLERDILNTCTDRNCKNVVRLLTTGGIDVSEAELYPRVEYLILEYADNGDIRSALQKGNEKKLVWQLRSLHQLSNGLRQIHDLSIAHQDIKPSNIVTFESGITKLTDFGSAVSLYGDDAILPYHIKKSIAGTWAYAPPELLYGEINSNPIIRRIGCDLYLLGSMVAYYFTNTNMTALIRANLSDSIAWTEPSTYGRYAEVKSYLYLAFQKALDDIAGSIQDRKIRDLVLLSVKYLCNPDPEKRGHERSIQQAGSNYSLYRFVTMFDLLAREYEIKSR